MERLDGNAGRNAPWVGHPPVERFFQFSLLGLITSGYLAVAGSGYLDAPTVALTAAGLVLRALIVCGWLRFNLTRRAATAVALGYAAFFPLDYFLLSRSFLSTIVHLVFFLAVMKVLTAKNNHDYLSVAAIAFLELLSAAILSIGFNFFVFLTLYLMFAIAALTSGEIRRASGKAPSTARSGMKRFHWRLALLTIWVALGILTLTAGMFFLLPRTADAARGLISHRIFTPGFSNQVTLGEIGELKTSSRPMMHIAIYYGNQWSAGLKWRGGVLTDFDGKTWSNPDRGVIIHRVENGHVVLPAQSHGPAARLMGYRVELAELDSPTLFFVGTPERIDGLANGILRETDGGCFRLRSAPAPGFRYEAASLLEEPAEGGLVQNPPPVLDLPTRIQDLQLPRLDPRIPALARELTAGAASDLERARALESHLRTDYGYTLQLPDREAQDPLAYFLFTRKKGYCEYFASAMAVMLRSLDIPARMATGFQSGVYNSMSDLWLVRASDAHSWVEAWIPGHGWTTFDPTPGDAGQQGMTLFSKMGLYLDAAETFWQSWVVDYDPGRQGTLADRILGIHWLDWLTSAAVAWDLHGKEWLRRFGPMVALAVGAVLWFWLVAPRLVRLLRLRRRVLRVRRGQVSMADATLLYERMLHVLKRHGYQKPPWFTPVEFARSLPGTDLGQAVQEFTIAYNALRFGGQTETAPRLSTLLDEMEKGKK